MPPNYPYVSQQSLASLSKLQYIKDVVSYPVRYRPFQVVSEIRPRGTDGWTTAGCVVVVANALIFAADPLQKACYMLGKLDPGTNDGQLNGYLYIAMVMLQSVLDGVAAACDRIAPVEGQGDIYFHSYTFVKSDIVWISGHQRAVAEVTWNGKAFRVVANTLKHELAWVGSVGESETHGVRDIYDTQGIGFVYSFLIPVYKHAKTIVCRLAQQMGQVVPVLPDL
jgi:hypothetical protein